MKIKFTNQGHLSTNVTPDIGLKDEPVLKYDVLVVANTFVDNCKQIATLSFKLFEKTQAISLYLSAAQQQTSTYRRQKFEWFYPEFSAEFN